MSEDITLDQSLSDGGDVAASDGGGAVGGVAGVRDVINSALGKRFESDEAALKAVKDTFSYVGKVGKVLPILDKLREQGVSEDVALSRLQQITESKTPDPSKFVSRDEFDEALFYSQNPDYKDQKTIIDALRKTTGKSLADVVQLEEFKTIYDKAKAHDATEKTKSVLMSNPRLGMVKDKLSQAREAASKGDEASARASAVGAVIDAYEIGK